MGGEMHPCARLFLLHGGSRLPAASLPSREDLHTSKAAGLLLQRVECLQQTQSNALDGIAIENCKVETGSNQDRLGPNRLWVTTKGSQSVQSRTSCWCTSMHGQRTPG